ncbi:type I 3-dehydroquinate dehydratase [Bacillus halotolerans]|uniref:type I 3-dehydroquinate dehydratase n=1 Tax=Bacillus TaxID=1386 RepID=UPI000D01E7FE|nr:MULTISPECIES: type I 3-dehydroquinate dehydratase [Bacillus]MBL6007319.1 type I 3-dehydroquinate dehydratase [Bacillus halotolerans]MCC2525938.1 type I 3-dehydroquinate dehydratase [Bacillus halotolerans]MCK8101080.1 type I 3-dehydroquinate dehydratase [Bacillus sp. 2CMS4F]MDY7430895.1 type I 3-dehydroquinate dehydratase [Bacillus sp. V26]MEC1604420.1 type I 3-dehydroquinate dehydratase [Bacillus halotolerans]
MNVLTIKGVSIGEGMPKIIVPLMGKTEKQILKEAEAVKLLDPDIVEWRVDVFEKADDNEAVIKMISKLRESLRDKLFLFTFRSHKEGGSKEMDVSSYIALLETAIRTKDIDFIDIELFSGEANVEALVSLAGENGVYVIMSNHDFQKTPEKDEIISRLRKMQELGAHIPKIAVMPKDAGDLLTLLDATYTMKTKYADRPMITMSMAGTGLVSRLSGEIFGSACTFGAGEEASAPGQIPVSELRNVLEVLHKHT